MKHGLLPDNMKPEQGMKNYRQSGKLFRISFQLLNITQLIGNRTKNFEGKIFCTVSYQSNAF
ncbi:hypothetical protein AVD48_15425 [Salmonella enterica subsp. enterica serovar Java]|nr:hypothetical protein [Salmonella enterica]EBV8497085.1 hypothetical protein [Salmonella enterica subsp. enterica serovar Java]EAV0849162.1 hypothetical protein [Salmonella enterica]EBI4218332.1 hypothetical protein [Salmonella enterica]EBW5004470.1 hypothetical protein [Salmonella enterica subsp. enterica serovar Java]